MSLGKLNRALRDHMAIVFNGANEIVHTINLLHVNRDNERVRVLLL